MKRCRTCVIPNTRPDTHFDESGECSACRSYRARKTIDWDARKADLLALLDRFDGRCIVPSSGGKDSTYQAITLKELGADVVCVTARTCHLTAIGRANIDNLSRYVQTVEVVPNMTERANLNRLCLETVGDISWPEHASIFSVPFHMALALDRPLIFYGENPQEAYGGPQGSDQARQMTLRWITEFGGFLGLRPSDLEPQFDMYWYQPPRAQDIERAGVEAHFLGQYLPWDSRRNAAFADSHGMHLMTPCTANWWRGENLDNAQTGIHDHAMYRKYGYGRGAAQISVDIRAGSISRDAALNWVRKYDGTFPQMYAGVSIRGVCDRINLSVADLYRILDSFTDWRIFRRVEDDASVTPVMLS